MPRYVAFLRAINVGGHIVKMDRLRGLFEEIRLANVETFIASGNVLFDSAAAKTDILERRIERHLEAALGYEVPTFVRIVRDLAAVTKSHPFADANDEGNSLWIGFLKSPPAVGQVAKFLGHRTADDEFHVNDRHAYWFRRGRMSDSKITGKSLEKAIGSPFTFRNVTTVTKLAAMGR